MRDTGVMPMPVPYCCNACHQAGRYTRESRHAYHSARVAQLRGPGGVGVLPGGPKAQKWWTRMLTVTIWAETARIIWYSVLLLGVLAVLGCVLYVLI